MSSWRKFCPRRQNVVQGEGNLCSPGSSSSPARSSGISSSAMLVWYEASSVLGSSNNKKTSERRSSLSAPPIPKKVQEMVSSWIQFQKMVSSWTRFTLSAGPSPPLARRPLAWSSVRGEAARARARCRANRSEPRKGKKPMVDPSWPASKPFLALDDGE